MSLVFSLIQRFSSAQKLGDIRNAVLNELNEHNNPCQCQITAENICQEQLLCMNASSNYVTYQAQISGSLENDSAFVTSLIEDWASSGPSIRVQGVLLGLGEDCTSDVSAEVCSILGSQTESDTYECTCQSTNTGAIVGALVAVATVLIIAAIAVATLLNLRRCKRGRYDVENREDELEIYAIP